MTPGFSSDFLPVAVPLPAPPPGVPVRRLDYTHFTVVLQPQRRLAAATAVNIDGEHLREIERADAWHFDRRVPESEQTGPAVYAANDLDRGHLVRRRDPVWGDPATAARANSETFTFTNAAPQAGDFNQSKELWLGLEDYVLGYADASRSRLSVFTGPVLAADDPPYRGIHLPRLFWKIAAWVTATGAVPGRLAATGYVLDQSSLLPPAEARRRTAEAARQAAVPPLGPFRTFQVPIADIAELTGLRLDPLVDADRFAPVPVGLIGEPGAAPDAAAETAPPPRESWRLLADYSGIHL